jgi:hypothetical protein
MAPGADPGAARDLQRDKIEESWERSAELLDGTPPRSAWGIGRIRVAVYG